MTGRPEKASLAFPDETLVERLAQPAVLTAWLAQIENAPPTRAQDPTLARRRAGLLRALGRLEDAARAYAELKTVEGDRLAALLTGTATGTAEETGPTRFVRLKGVLSAAEQQRLWNRVEADDARFDQARIGQTDKARLNPDRRRSATLADDAPVREWFLPRIEELIERERVLERLCMAPFPVAMRELQITRHLDGGFYRMHRDTGLPGDPAASRILTYVYYFHRTPRRFSGGDLLMFDHGPDGRRAETLEFTRFHPEHDTLMFFPSHRLHAVAPVTLDGDDPSDARWTVNGWLHTS
ncbi:2OG-Fe(II) oxygenase [Azospirillum griseum]|uniref:2OG-Fe(II) oxygenase n=1 Tax=Azospirillum griseum TaxID=2496639 RepID=A0A3S0KUQ0_9PROT|nr:2OG-Fe(II) oxygenase [Azospirillum griseum]RTR14183.1 2OG-Fe(II) oxygenase [Azospirillum griseum]